jgi:hypothetical protein
MGLSSHRSALTPQCLWTGRPMPDNWRYQKLVDRTIRSIAPAAAPG